MMPVKGLYFDWGGGLMKSGGIKGNGKSQSNSTVIKISEDSLKAYAYICPDQGKGSYTKEELYQKLKEYKVTYGLLEDEIEAVINEKRYYEDVLIATGEEPINGENGQFEFLFNTNVDTRPKILVDGSVDYRSMGEVPIVEKGDEIVRYIAATKGKNGMNVRGSVIPAKNGKELLALRGKGFYMSEDKTTYYASITGKVTYKDKLIVSNIFEISGDITNATGNVNFVGDVIIRGGVTTGCIIRASGSITVDGNVEAAQLIAGKDVTLKIGMQGGGIGYIEAGGNVSGKFFEQVKVIAKGNVSANAMLNCDIETEEAVIVSGKFGAIIGGTIMAYRGISATTIGNMSEVKTKIYTGTERDLYIELMQIENEIKGLLKDLEKCLHGIERIDEMIEQNPEKESLLSKKRVEIIRLKIEKDSLISKKSEIKQQILVTMEKVSDSKITVRKSIYPGVEISINGTKEFLKTENYNVTYQKRATEITCFANI